MGEALLELETEEEAAQGPPFAGSADAGILSEEPASSSGSAEESALDSSTQAQVSTPQAFPSQYQATRAP